MNASLSSVLRQRENEDQRAREQENLTHKLDEVVILADEEIALLVIHRNDRVLQQNILSVDDSVEERHCLSALRRAFDARRDEVVIYAFRPYPFRAGCVAFALTLLSVSPAGVRRRST